MKSVRHKTIEEQLSNDSQWQEDQLSHAGYHSSIQIQPASLFLMYQPTESYIFTLSTLVDIKYQNSKIRGVLLPFVLLPQSSEQQK